jgi:carbonic anhydrase/acetyltransferase-like protein (isoleucine patch superfamily)
VNRILIGARTNIQDLSCLQVTHDGPYSRGGRHLEIGALVTMGHGVIAHACSIGDFCLIGMGSILMDDVEIAPHYMIAAGSLLSPGTQASSGMLYRGRPARPVRSLTDSEMELLSYSANHYVRLKDRYLDAGS